MHFIDTELDATTPKLYKYYVKVESNDPVVINFDSIINVGYYSSNFYLKTYPTDNTFMSFARNSLTWPISVDYNSKWVRYASTNPSVCSKQPNMRVSKNLGYDLFEYNYNKRVSDDGSTIDYTETQDSYIKCQFLKELLTNDDNSTDLVLDEGFDVVSPYILADSEDLAGELIVTDLTIPFPDSVNMKGIDNFWPPFDGLTRLNYGRTYEPVVFIMEHEYNSELLDVDIYGLGFMLDLKNNYENNKLNISIYKYEIGSCITLEWS
jgi:hypothetical protein